jgi:predicted MFS family arabinose efflux permease
MKNLWNRYIEAFDGLPRDAWLLALVVLINRSGSMVLFFMTLYLTDHLGFDVLTAGRTLSIYGIGSLAGSYIGGWLCDRWGANRVQLFSLVLAGLGYILLGYIRSVSGIAVMMMILALVADAFKPANVTAFAMACRPEIRTRGFALMRLAINLGIVIGPALGGFLAVKDYRLIFWADGLTSLAAAGFFWRIFKGRKSPQTAQEEDEIRTPQSPWRDRIFLYLMALILVIGIGFFQLFGTWPLYLKQVCLLRENQIGFLLAINGLMIVFLEMQIMHRLGKQNPIRVIAVGSLFLFGGFFLLPVNHSYPFIVATSIIWTIGEILTLPMTATFIANRAGGRRTGMYMGVYTLTFSLAMVLAPIIGSYVYQHLGSTALWIGYGFVGLGVFAGLNLMRLFLRREGRMAQQEV